MPGTATDLGVRDPFDSAQNVRGGRQYLAGCWRATAMCASAETACSASPLSRSV
jgi:membrane-bound lytic murein transglycosylase MltF